MFLILLVSLTVRPLSFSHWRGTEPTVGNEFRHPRRNFGGAKSFCRFSLFCAFGRLILILDIHRFPIRLPFNSRLPKFNLVFSL